MLFQASRSDVRWPGSNRGGVRRHRRRGLAVGAGRSPPPRASAASPPPRARPRAARERELKALPSAKAAEADFDVMTAEPHHTGSPYEIKLADYVSDQFKQFGIESTKYEYSVLLPWPGQRRIDIVAPDQVKLRGRGRKDPRRSVGRQAGHPSGLQRLFAVRRRHRRDRLRELRHPGRLRDAATSSAST